MTEVIVDTNVPLTADGNHMSDACRSCCAEFVKSVIRGDHKVVLDNQWHILGEYQNKMPSGTQNSFGRQFLKYVYSNQCNPDRIKQVGISFTGTDDFEEFPEKLRTIGFDASDRKFVATAVSNNGKAPIVQATDSKWIGWESALKREKVKVRFLCKEELTRIFSQKMA